jgi:hypothetical protein
MNPSHNDNTCTMQVVPRKKKLCKPCDGKNRNQGMHLSCMAACPVHPATNLRMECPLIRQWWQSMSVYCPHLGRQKFHHRCQHSSSMSSTLSAGACMRCHGLLQPVLQTSWCSFGQNLMSRATPKIKRSNVFFRSKKIVRNLGRVFCLSVCLRKMGGRKPALLSEGRLLSLCLLMAHGALAFSPSMPLRTLSKNAVNGPYSQKYTEAHGSCGVDRMGRPMTVMMADNQNKAFGGEKTLGNPFFPMQMEKILTCFFLFGWDFLGFGKWLQKTIQENMGVESPDVAKKQREAQRFVAKKEEEEEEEGVKPDYNFKFSAVRKENAYKSPKRRL